MHSTTTSSSSSLLSSSCYYDVSSKSPSRRSRTSGCTWFQVAVILFQVAVGSTTASGLWKNSPSSSSSSSSLSSPPLVVAIQYKDYEDVDHHHHRHGRSALRYSDNNNDNDSTFQRQRQQQQRRRPWHSARVFPTAANVDTAGTAFGFFTKSQNNNQSKTKQQQQHQASRSYAAASTTNWRQWFSSLPLLLRRQQKTNSCSSSTSLHLLTPLQQQQQQQQETRQNGLMPSFCSSQPQVQEETQVMMTASTTATEQVVIPEFTATTTTTTTTTTPTPAKVHVAATSEKDDDNDDGDEEHPSKSNALAVLYSFTDPSTNITYSALNTSKRKFQSWLTYLLGSRRDTTTSSSHSHDTTHHDHVSPQQAPPLPNGRIIITTRHIWLNETSTRQELRSLWRQGRLLSDRTEVLAVYQSDLQQHQLPGGGTAAAAAAVAPTNDELDDDNDDRPIVAKRGGFADLLHMYTDRLLGILNDERDDDDYRIRNYHHHNDNDNPVDSIHQTLRHDLLPWLEQHYGTAETHAMSAKEFGLVSRTEQYARLQHFLDWFRANFPYYYDQCAACGASGRDRPVAAAITANDDDDEEEEKEKRHHPDGTNNPEHDNGPHQHAMVGDQQGNEEIGDDDEDDDDDDDGTFLGYVYPNAEELAGKAGRTELYQCYKCGHFSRFPRYNAATFVLRDHKGRCGEYSMLLVRMLRRLGHQVRWVCDWADHVWAEILLGPDDGNVTPDGATSQRQSRWVHLDPCESAVDKPLLYQEWGKTQTYIVAFATPRVGAAPSLCGDGSSPPVPADLTSPLGWMEDVTKDYTSDSWEDIWQRRDESKEEIQAAFEQASKYLIRKLVPPPSPIDNNNNNNVLNPPTN